MKQFQYILYFKLFGHCLSAGFWKILVQIMHQDLLKKKISVIKTVSDIEISKNIPFRLI